MTIFGKGHRLKTFFSKTDFVMPVAITMFLLVGGLAIFILVKSGQKEMANDEPLRVYQRE